VRKREKNGENGRFAFSRFRHFHGSFSNAKSPKTTVFARKLVFGRETSVQNQHFVKMFKFCLSQ